MKARDLADGSSAQTAAMDPLISEVLKEDPEEVVHALAEVVKRCKAEGRYTEEEIEAAAAQLRREIGITRE